MDIRDLQETANLAHLNLSEEELKAAFPSFEEMLAFFAAMQTADLEEKSVSGSASVAEGMAASARTVNSGFLRPDNPKPRIEGLSEEMLQKAGERDGSFIVIPNVL